MIVYRADSLDFMLSQALAINKNSLRNKITYCVYLANAYVYIQSTLLGIQIDIDFTFNNGRVRS
jgi:hypothetical protein